MSLARAREPDVVQSLPAMEGSCSSDAGQARRRGSVERLSKVSAWRRPGDRAKAREVLRGSDQASVAAEGTPPTDPRRDLKRRRNYSIAKTRLKTTSNA